jgi:hypothetical protein
LKIKTHDQNSSIKIDKILPRNLDLQIALISYKNSDLQRIKDLRANMLMQVINPSNRLVTQNAVPLLAVFWLLLTTSSGKYSSVA